MQQMLPLQKVESATFSNTSWDNLIGLKIVINPGFRERRFFSKRSKLKFPAGFQAVLILYIRKRGYDYCYLFLFVWDPISTLRMKAVQWSLQACSMPVTV